MGETDGRQGAGRPSGERTRGGRNRWAVATALGGVLVAVLLVLSVPVAAPISHADTLVPAVTTTFKAPYAGAPQQAFEWVSDGTCGAKAVATTAPTFNMTTGVFKGAVNGTAAACGAFNDTLEAIEFGGVATAGAIPFTTTTGKHTVRVFWTVVYTPTLTAHATKTAFASAASIVFLYAEVYDLTNGTIFSTPFPFALENATNSSTVSHQSTAKATLTITEKLVAGHRYAIESYIEAVVIADANPGAKTAYASLNLATLGNKATLTSATLT